MIKRNKARANDKHLKAKGKSSQQHLNDGKKLNHQKNTDQQNNYCEIDGVWKQQIKYELNGSVNQAYDVISWKALSSNQSIEKIGHQKKLDIKNIGIENLAKCVQNQKLNGEIVDDILYEPISVASSSELVKQPTMPNPATVTTNNSLTSENDLNLNVESSHYGPEIKDNVLYGSLNYSQIQKKRYFSADDTSPCCGLETNGSQRFSKSLTEHITESRDILNLTANGEEWISQYESYTTDMVEEALHGSSSSANKLNNRQKASHRNQDIISPNNSYEVIDKCFE
uniref:uncharacterized protein LOC120325465 n=1 Tax=Styela clava TaxID=7725 RepID=UPI00193A75EA|nr:uncharacterized protein LOC120325465 [Styela clava]